MTLAGGDYRLLTFEEFLNAGYTLLIDEFLRLGQGLDLMAAQEQLGLLPKKPPPPPAVATARNEEVVARQNTDSMRELEKMMKGASR